MLGRWLERFYDWLSPADTAGRGDLIFALAGRQSRKRFALELLDQDRASSLLLSVGRFEIRKFGQLAWPEEVDLPTLAAPVPAPQRHYFVGFEAGRTRVEWVATGRLGTWSEIHALAAWLEHRPEMESVLVVSSGFHLRRVRACCRALLPARLRLSFVATPEDGCFTRSRWWRNRWACKVVLKEAAKCCIYRLLLATGMGRRHH